jgi:apolipoprotein N-acyltransferase
VKSTLVSPKGGAAVGGRYFRECGCDPSNWRTPAVGPTTAWAVSFLYAGSSALLLLIANLFPSYWYLSFVALAPFLYKSSRSDQVEGLRLGFFFGVTFLTVSGIDAITVSPIAAALKILLGTGLFSLFGWTVGWARRNFGFNPFVVGLLWVAFESGLVRLGFDNGLFAEASLSASFLHSIATLFGFLIVALIIVLVNSLLIVALEVAVSFARARGHAVTEGKRKWDLFPSPGLVAQRLWLVAEGRGPPTSKQGN